MNFKNMNCKNSKSRPANRWLVRAIAVVALPCVSALGAAAFGPA
jgi:hypothetical protein